MHVLLNPNDPTYLDHNATTLMPIQEITEIPHSRGALVHTDAAQAVGKIAVRVDERLAPRR